MKKSFLILAVILCGVFLSCSEDDEVQVDQSSEEDIIGEWTMVQILFEGNPVDLICPDEAILNFKSDKNGTLANKEFQESSINADECSLQEESEFPFVWNFLGNNTYRIQSEDSEDSTMDITIIDNTIILEFTNIDEVAGTEEVFQRVFRKQ